MRQVQQTSQREDLWEDVRREFPDDSMMQEIHHIRLLHYQQTKRMTPTERVRFFDAALTTQTRSS